MTAIALFLRLLAATSLTAVLAAPLVSATAAEMDIKVRNHRGAQVIVRPIGRYQDMVIVREFYEWDGERNTNSLYQFECDKHRLRYIGWADDEWHAEGKFYDGAYRKAHAQMCKDYKDPHEQYKP